MGGGADLEAASPSGGAENNPEHCLIPMFAHDPAPRGYNAVLPANGLLLVRCWKLGPGCCATFLLLAAPFSAGHGESRSLSRDLDLASGNSL